MLLSAGPQILRGRLQILGWCPCSTRDTVPMPVAHFLQGQKVCGQRFCKITVLEPRTSSPLGKDTINPLEWHTWLSGMAKQRLSNWIVDVILHAYRSQGLPTSRNMRYHYTRSVSTSRATLKGLSARHLCCCNLGVIM